MHYGVGDKARLKTERMEHVFNLCFSIQKLKRPTIILRGFAPFLQAERLVFNSSMSLESFTCCIWEWLTDQVMAVD